MNTARFILCASLWLFPFSSAFAQRPFTTQIAALSSQAEAETKVEELKFQGFEGYWIKSTVPGAGVRYRVRVGRFSTRAAAQACGEKLRKQGLAQDYFVTEYEAPPKAAAPKAAPTTAPAPPPVENEAALRPRITAPAAATVSQRVAINPPVTKPGTPVTPPTKADPGKGGKATALTRASKPVNPGFVIFSDPAVGYSLEHPNYWSGAVWGEAEKSGQNVDAGASFKSREDAAFLNVIWNKLPGASDPKKYDNKPLVDMIVKSMGSGEDTQSLNELSRRVEDEGSQIRTYLELNALFRDPNSATPLNFLGKAVIARCQQGILLVVVFYSQDAPTIAGVNADRIVRSVRPPE
jgi:hypothetical protein